MPVRYLVICRWLGSWIFPHPDQCQIQRRNGHRGQQSLQGEADNRDICYINLIHEKAKAVAYVREFLGVADLVVLTNSSRVSLTPFVFSLARIYWTLSSPRTSVIK